MKRSAIVCLTIMLVKDVVHATSVVSTKIDLDSNEIQDVSPCDDPSKEGSKETQRVTNEQKESSFRMTGHRSPLVHREGQSFVRPVLSEDSRRRWTRLSTVSSINEPKVVNNVRIFVNGNETAKSSSSNATSCENGLCDVSVSSRVDEDGTVVTDVHVTIITKPKPRIEVAEIPVIDGFRGTEENERRPSRPVFRTFERARPTFTHVLRNDIPQVQIRGFQESNNGEARFPDRRTYGGVSPSAWYNSRNHQHAYRAFQDSRSWLPRRVIVDDKIETPLSKTKYSDE